MTISLDTHTKCNGTELAGLPELSLTLPGIPAAISVVRSVIAQALTDCPCTDEVALVGCEYATNAIRHSPSGLPGGVFTMRIWAWPGRVRLEIIDSGTGEWLVAPGEPAEPSPDAESGRGLNVVAAIADACGNCGCRAWAEMAWPLVNPGRVPAGQSRFLV